MKHGYRAICFAFCSILLGSAIPSAMGAEPAPPTTQPAGTITGIVSSPGEVPLSEMVVFLAPDDNQTITPPTETAKVSQKDAKFAPSLVIVCVGQSVDFLNDEERLIEHNVFSNSPAKQFDLGLYKPGEGRLVTFDKTGPVFLYCSIHRHMDGVVYVTPSPYFSRVAPDGKYQIDNIPPGHWVISTWQRRRRFQEVRANIKVSAGETMTQDLVLKAK